MDEQRETYKQHVLARAGRTEWVCVSYALCASVKLALSNIFCALAHEHSTSVLNGGRLLAFPCLTLSVETGWQCTLFRFELAARTKLFAEDQLFCHE